MKLTRSEIDGLAQAVISAIYPEDQSIAEVLYGQYMNAIVVYFDYRDTNEPDVETLDGALGRLDDRTDKVADAIIYWFNDEIEGFEFVEEDTE